MLSALSHREAGESLIIHYLLYKLGSLMELFSDIELKCLIRECWDVPMFHYSDLPFGDPYPGLRTQQHYMLIKVDISV